MTSLPADDRDSAKTVEPSLHRVMGPWLLLLFIVGDILGIVLWLVTVLVNRATGVKPAEPQLGEADMRRPVN